MQAMQGRPAMQRITFANQKGGAAKTTTAVCVAGVLAEQGRVLLIDCDAQAAASRWLGVAPGDGLRQVLARRRGEPRASLTDLVAPGAGAIDVVPASPALAALDRLAGDPEAGGVGIERALLRALEELDGKGWDWVLLDTPPNLGMATIAAITAARHVVVPFVAGAIDLAGVARVSELVGDVAERLDVEVSIAAYVPCRVKAGTSLGRDVLDALTRRFGAAVTPAVRDTVKLAEAPGFHEPITVYAPDHPAAQDYRAVTAAILDRIGVRA
jgi:chromosome partitioning protein